MSSPLTHTEHCKHCFQPMVLSVDYATSEHYICMNPHCPDPPKLSSLEELRSGLTATEHMKFVDAISCKDYASMHERMSGTLMLRLMHAQLGLCSEVGEFADALKKVMIYGRTVDITNLEEECGDLYWYLAEALIAMGANPERAMAKNILKLRARYGGDKFSTDKALNRDTDAERKVLEQK